MKLALTPTSFKDKLIGLLFTVIIIAVLFTTAWWYMLVFLLAFGLVMWVMLRLDSEVEQPVSPWIIICLPLIFPSLLFGVKVILDRRK